jgi:hypothetical protein
MHGGGQNGGAGLSIGTNGISVYEHGSFYMPAPAVFKGGIGRSFGIVTIRYHEKRPSIFFQGNLVRTGLASPRSTVTAPTELGSGAYGSFQGEVAEILIFNRALETNQRRALEEYLAQKYGLKLPLFLHTNFSISANGERLFLTRPDGSLADELDGAISPRDVSFGRQPDGSGAWRFFSQATPGSPNSTPGAVELLQAPEFSHAAGFYTDSFLLTLSVTNRAAAIRYTLDSSEPTEASPVYSNPLAITNRANMPNKLSLLATVPGYQRPAGVVFKGTVVRAKAFKAGSLPSATMTRRFFVHPKGRARYSVPVISLATDQANFFDLKIGIYVPGTAPEGNYSRRGKEWERPVHVEFLETNGTVAFSQDGDVKIHGNTSQTFPIKGLDLDATGGSGRVAFRHQIFPNRAQAGFEHILLRPSGHDHHLAFMRDELMQSLAAEFGAETQAARLAVVFLNGEYWGLHYLKEKEDTDFVAHYANRAAESIDFLESYAVARAGDTRHYDAMIQFIQTHKLSDPAKYARVGELMDVPNYIDYKVAEIFCYRWDIGNHRLWRPRTPEGRWRWLQFDNDVGWGGFWAVQAAWNFNMLQADMTPSGSLYGHNTEATTFLLRRLLESASFKRDFINRFADLLNTVYEPAHTVARINQLAAVLEPEMQEHTARWRNPASLTEWRSNVQSLRAFAKRRPEFARQHLVRKFGLGGTAALSLGVADSGQGSFRLNTIQIAPTPGTDWKGVYFKGNAITISAVPAPAFRFKEWQGAPGGTTNPMSLELTGDLTLKAVFQPVPSSIPALDAFEGTEAGTIQFHCRGKLRQQYALEVSTDLVVWQTIQTLITDGQGEKILEVRPEANSPTRFFRLRES